MNIYLVYATLFFQAIITHELVRARRDTFRRGGGQSDNMRPEYQRCTRRYSPGNCLQPVQVVWTFYFQIQNCTERLGCPTSSRTNRFQKYAHCMRRCRAVADLYGQMLLVDGRNDSELVPPVEFSRRFSEELDTPQDPVIPEDDTEVYETPTSWNYHEDDQDPADLDLLTPDIDRVENVHRPDNDDIFHPFD